MKTDLTPTGAPRVTRETADLKLPVIGEWYWVKADGRESTRKWLGAVVHVGSNYVQLRGPRPIDGRRAAGPPRAGTWPPRWSVSVRRKPTIGRSAGAGPVDCASGGGSEAG